MTALKDLDPSSSPRAFFGADLRRRRLAAGLTQDEVGLKISYTSSLVGLVEHGLRFPSQGFAKDCDDLLAADGALIRLWELMDRCGVGPVQPDQLVDLERDAMELRAFGAMRVPWMLQTADYARAVLAAGSSRTTRQSLSPAVDALIARQRAIVGKPGWVVLDESLFRRPVGGRDVMRAQLEQIARCAAQSPLTVQVVPIDAGEYAGLGGDLTLLSLPEGCLVGYTDGYGVFSIESQTAVGSCAHAFDLIRAAALGPRQSLALVESAVDAL